MELTPGAPHCYAGLGIMLNQPKLALQIRTTDRALLQTADPEVAFSDNLGVSEESLSEYRKRIQSQSLEDRHNACHRDPCVVRLAEAYPFHCGLGTGTQLAALLNVARELFGSQPYPASLSDNWHCITSLLPDLSHHKLAEQTGRGQRSGVGVYGFLHGNLVLDSGTGDSTDQPQDRLSEHYSIPEEWRFVLIRCSESSRITGSRENELLKEIARRPYASSQRMWQLATACCKAAKNCDFDCFTSLLESYLDLATGLFTSIQGGKFNGPECSQAVTEAVDGGLRAVGQSSWGPTIFGVAQDRETAADIARWIASRNPLWTVQTAAVSTAGAQARIVNCTDSG